MPKLNFEKTMTELEEIVNKMENGDVTLEEALSLFEKGIKLSKNCQKILDDAEKKVTVLLSSDDGEITEKPFDTDSDE